MTVLDTVLGDYRHTAPLKQGEVTDPAVRLEFREISPVHKAFAPMVREGAYDLSELAIVTALQAIAYERPVVLLPAVVAARFQRRALVAAASRGVPAPEDLAGKRIGVRAFTQTTGLWVRAHLSADYGIAPDEIRWITRDGAHVQEYEDPPFVEHGIDERGLIGMLRDGDLDAAIFGNDLPEGDEFAPVIRDAAVRDREFWRQSGFVPINHMVVARKSTVDEHPDAVRAAYGLLKRAEESVPRTVGDPAPTAFGFERLCRPLETVIATCLEQRLLPRPLTVDEVFGPARTLLGRLGD